MRGGDSQLDRICFQVFITRGAKVSRERPGSFVLLMAQTVSSVTARAAGLPCWLLWSPVIAKPIHQHR